MRGRVRISNYLDLLSRSILILSNWLLRFCPDESQCFEGKWLAYCCLAKESGEAPQLINEDSPYQ